MHQDQNLILLQQALHIKKVCGTAEQGLNCVRPHIPPMKMIPNEKHWIESDAHGVSNKWLAWALLSLIGSTLSAAPLAWYPGPDLGSPRSGAATTVDSNGFNLLIGGESDGTPQYLVQELGAANSYWTYPAVYNFNNPTVGGGAIGGGGMITYFGGDDGTGATNAVYSFSPSDGVSALASLQTARSYLGYAKDRNGNAYAFGGLDANGQPLASAEMYNQDSNAWSSVTSLPAPRYQFPAVFDGTNSIYVFGGITDAVNKSELATVLRYSVSVKTWTPMASMPTAVAGSAAAMGPDGKIYVAGGITGGAATNAVQVYNPTSNTWTSGTPLPEALSEAAIAVDSLGRLLVMGGVDINGNDLTDVWRSQQLNVPDSAPAFTQYPGTTGTYLGTYSSSINASGSPPPTYTLVSGPTGMQVDYFTGAVTWTPQGLAQIGSNPVTIQAANYAGSVNWSFNITVPNPPPTVVTNLTVTGVTESSVSLSWNPEDPTVGAVTYSVYLGHAIHGSKGSGGTVIYTQIGSSTSGTNITLSGLAAGLSQAYYVRAVGVSGTSGYASIGAATLPAPAPTNLQIIGLTSTSVTLAWTAPAGGLPLASYDLIGVYNGVFSQNPIGIASISGTTITVTGLSPGTSVLWGVTALDTAGNTSAYIYLPSLVTNPVPATPVVNGIVPLPNGGLQLTVRETGTILQTVLIEANTNPANSAGWTQIGSVLPSTSTFTFTDVDAPLYPTRFYRVIAP